jgi:hypothetical protein
VALKAQSCEGGLDEASFQPIKSFSKIDFEKESLLPPCLEMKRIDDFLCDNDVGGHVHVLNKSSLRVVNEVG